jgi:hypothetical protein
MAVPVQPPLGRLILATTDRLRSGPWAVLGRAALITIVAVPAAWIHHHHDPGPLCPLRRLTGLPCPVCGSTTLVMELGAGRPLAALAANPMTMLALCALVLAPIGAGRWWWRLTGRHQITLLSVALALSWVWQLHRFGFLP